MFREAGVDGPADAVYLLVSPDCVFQPYPNRPAATPPASLAMRNFGLIASGTLILCAVAAGAAVAHDRMYGARLADQLAPAAVPPSGFLAEAGAVIAVARAHHRPPATGGNDLAAGAALHRLLWTEGSPTLARPAHPIAERWESARYERNPLALKPGEWHQLPARAATLTGPQIAFVQQLEAHPAAGAFQEFARSRSADVIGARFQHPLPKGGPATLMADTALDYHWLSFAGGLWSARTAVALRQGRVADAERLAREALNASLLLWDESGSMLDLVHGRMMAERALVALAAVHRAAGNEQAAVEIERALASARSTPRAPIVSPHVGAAELFSILPAIAARRDVPLGYKLDLAASTKMVGYVRWCRDLRAPMQDAAWRKSVSAATGGRQSHRDQMDWVLRLPESQTACRAAPPVTVAAQR